MLLSLILTSQNRFDEINRFVQSLNAQKGIDFSMVQLIFVDQGHNRQAFKMLNPEIELNYIPYKNCSLSEARNYALDFVKGEYIGFPDDDCWYEEKTLQQVLEELKAYNGVICKGTDENGVNTNNFPTQKQCITLFDHCGAISYTIFLKFIRDIKFDENIGVGSKYNLSSGEETDYLIQVIKKIGTQIIFNPEIIVHHPKKKLGNFNSEIQKKYGYARGWGYILRKNKYPFSVLFKSFIRPLIGCIGYYIMLRPHQAKLSYTVLKGRITGYFYQIKK